ncbi:MAG: hypothetical protein ABIT69_07850 [Sphingomicrobium sp.]
MIFHRLTPLHGWRAFWGEVGIIVLGVLIALGAQQVVESVNWRHEVAGFRDAVRDEMGENLDSYPYRAKQKACIKARLDELQHWLNAWRGGRGFTLTGPIGIPASRVIRTSVWDSTDPVTLAHLPRDERIEYSFLYSEFSNNEVHRLDEREAWIELASFDGATMLDHQDQMRLQGLISRARLRDERIDNNADRFLKRAAKKSNLYPKPIGDPPTYDPRLCVPILPVGQRAL